MPKDVVRITLITFGAILLLAFRGCLVSAQNGYENLWPDLWPALALVASISCFLHAVVPTNRIMAFASFALVQVFIFGRVAAAASNDAAGFLTPGRALLVLPELAGLAMAHAIVWRWNIWPHTRGPKKEPRAS